ncbi:MAG: hypothetical protein AAGF26_13930 [Cyanobacteria bacterium P01_G01_bin.49]
MQKYLENHWRKFNFGIDIFGLDLRSLAVLRIGLALIIMTDLISRGQDINAYYTEAELLSRETLAQEFFAPWYWLSQLINDHLIVQVFLLLLSFLSALSLLVGYRTRIAIIATWFLNIFVQHQNNTSIFAGDDILQGILLLTMFLPLGCAYSMDSALNSSIKPLPKQVISGATVIFIVQLIFIYTWSALYRTTSEFWWTNEDAVYYFLDLHQYVTELEHFLLGFPLSILQIFTLAALIIKWIGPLIILIPFRTSFFRCVAIISFIVLHIGFELSFSIGLLSYLSIVYWLTLIPTKVWDWGSKLIRKQPQQGLTIYYDADCGFCKKVVYLIRTFLILPGTPLLIAQSNESIYADMLEKNSWVVVDWQENRHYKFEAICYVVSLSPILYFLESILRWQPIMNGGTKFYQMIASNRKVAGNFTRPFKFRPLTAKTSLPVNIIALSLMFLYYCLIIDALHDYPTLFSSTIINVAPLLQLCCP